MTAPALRVCSPAADDTLARALNQFPEALETLQPMPSLPSLTQMKKQHSTVMLKLK